MKVFGNVDCNVPTWDRSPSEERPRQAIDKHRQRDAEDDFWAPVCQARKRRRAPEDEVEVLLPRKVHVTEQLRNPKCAPHAQMRGLARVAIAHPVARWIRKEVGSVLYRGWVCLCTELAREMDRHEAEWRELERQHTEQTRRWKEDEKLHQGVVSLSALVQPNMPVPVNEQEREQEGHQEKGPQEMVQGNSEQSAVATHEALDLTDDYVYPEFPNLAAHRELMTGDLLYGEFDCEYCEEEVQVMRELRLHIVDEHLYMTGAARPAGSIMEIGLEEEDE